MPNALSKGPLNSILSLFNKKVAISSKKNKAKQKTKKKKSKKRE